MNAIAAFVLPVCGSPACEHADLERRRLGRRQSFVVRHVVPSNTPATAASCALVCDDRLQDRSIAVRSPTSVPVGQDGIDRCRPAAPAPPRRPRRSGTSCIRTSGAAERGGIVRDRLHCRVSDDPEVVGGVAPTPPRRVHEHQHRDHGDVQDRRDQEAALAQPHPEVAARRPAARRRGRRRSRRRPRGTARRARAERARTSVDVALRRGRRRARAGDRRPRRAPALRRRPRRRPIATPGTTVHQSPGASATSTRHRFRARDARSSSIVPVAATRPRSIRTTSSHRRSTRSSWWLENTTAAPCSRASRRSTPASTSTPTGSSPENGSSSTSSSGRWTSAAASWTRCWLPSERDSIRSPSGPPPPRGVSSRARRAFARVLPCPSRGAGRGTRAARAPASSGRARAPPACSRTGGAPRCRSARPRQRTVARVRLRAPRARSASRSSCRRRCVRRTPRSGPSGT